MSDHEMQVIDQAHESDPAQQIAPVPRVSIQAFCETSATASVVSDAMGDRRMSKAHVKVHMGGGPAAVETYRSAPTPNVILIESTSDKQALIQSLDDLSEFCDAGTKVIVAGRLNDIALYRDLMARGVSEYLVAPFDVVTFIRAISELYSMPGAEPVGRVIAVTGAKGGVGASTIAHNLAWSTARDLDLATVVADLDLGFGTAGLDFNQDPPQGIAEAVFAPDRLDAAMLDRLLSKCSEKLSLLAAPAALDRMYDFNETSFDTIVDVLRSTMPIIVLDVPHMWSAWSRRMLVAADDVLVVASPDLANLRNAKNIFDNLRAARPNDAKPKLVMNFVGVQKRPEIGVADFAKAIEVDPAIIIPFDPKLFGTASNNGQMIAEVDPANPVSASFSEMARLMTGRAELRKAKKSLLDPILQRLRKKAS